MDGIVVPGFGLMQTRRPEDATGIKDAYGLSRLPVPIFRLAGLYPDRVLVYPDTAELLPSLLQLPVCTKKTPFNFHNVSRTWNREIVTTLHSAYLFEAIGRRILRTYSD
jgi:hypothetical protein